MQAQRESKVGRQARRTVMVLLFGLCTAHCGSDEASNGGSAGSGASAASGGGGTGGSGGTGAADAGGSAAADTGGRAGAGGTVDCSAPGPSWDAAWVAIEQEVIDLVNGRREAGATCGIATIAPVAAVTRDDALTLNARSHSLYMSTEGVGTSGPEGSPPSEWGLRCFAGTTIATNVAMGQPDAASLMDALMADPSVCKNVLADATHIGVGHYSTSAPDAGTGDAASDAASSGGNVFWTMLLAR